ncbi:MAG TPA: ATP-binding protein [Burkholderiales bacterium]|nr:ATP-binding protein [Burkholderiales bacterium]
MKPKEIPEQNEAQGTYKIPALRALSEITTSLAGESDIEDLLDRFLGTMIRLAGAEAGAVRVLTTDGRHLRLVGTRGFPADTLRRACHMDVECGVCADAIRRHAVDCSSDMAICLEPMGAQFAAARRHKIVPVPLRYQGKVLGVYNLYLPAGHSIPEDVAILFQSIGEHLGMALENARLARENMRVTLMDERQMLANEIHDSLAQTLAYMKMRLALLQGSVEEGDCELSFRYMYDVSEALDSAYSSLRELLTQFRNRMDPRGLLPALEDLCQTFRQRTGVEIELVNRSSGLALTPDHEVQVFHIVQEALANIHKHASAQRVRVSLEVADGNNRVTIEDNGIGMKTAEPEPMHFGLSIMRERAQRLKGEIEYQSRPGEGTTVVLSFPTQPAPAGIRP